MRFFRYSPSCSSFGYRGMTRLLLSSSTVGGPEAPSSDGGRRFSKSSAQVQFRHPARYVCRRFRLRSMLKDISISLDLAVQTGAAVEHEHTRVEMWERARRVLSPGADSMEIARWFEAEATR